jgi:hypothetical protein
MEDERRRQVERLYHSVLEISPDQRDAFLKRECPEGLGTARPWESISKSSRQSKLSHVRVPSRRVGHWFIRHPAPDARKSSTVISGLLVRTKPLARRTLPRG